MGSEGVANAEAASGGIQGDGAVSAEAASTGLQIEDTPPAALAASSSSSSQAATGSPLPPSSILPAPVPPPLPAMEFEGWPPEIDAWEIRQGGFQGCKVVIANVKVVPEEEKVMEEFTSRVLQLAEVRLEDTEYRVR
eukprot:g22101.t1